MGLVFLPKLKALQVAFITIKWGIFMNLKGIKNVAKMVYVLFFGGGGDV